MFKIGDVVVSRKEYLADYETEKDTLGIVLDYNPDNDYLLLGTSDPSRYAISSTFSMRGCYYRLATNKEKKTWGKSAV